MAEPPDLVRSIYADWERGDFSRADWADHEIEYTQDEFGAFMRASWKGLANMAKGARARIEVFADIGVHADEYRQLDDRRVLVLDRRTGTTKHSGIEFGGATRMPTAGAHLFTIQRGKVTALVAYYDRDRAIADLGLEE